MKKSRVIFLTLSLVTRLSAQVQIGNDIIGEAIEDYSGESVSMPDGNTIAIGAPNNFNSSGHVRVYTWDGVKWAQKGTDIDGESFYDYSGTSVSMPDANTIAIGADWNFGSATHSGHVRIYVWNGNNWEQKGVDIDGKEEDATSGASVSMPDANTVAIGATYHSSSGANNTGSVSIYNWNGTAWIQKGTDIKGEGKYDRFGNSVSMPDANTVAIGAPYNDNAGGSSSGLARIYTWNGTAWIQKGSDLEGKGESEYLGFSVSMSDSNTIALGAIQGGSLPGYTRIFNWNGSVWEQKGADINGTTANEWFGYSISLSDSNTIAVGSRDTPLNGVDRVGYVRIYSWSGTSWMQMGAGIYGQSKYDGFGASVSMPDKNTIGIGAPYTSAQGNITAGYVQVYSLTTVGLNNNSRNVGVLSIYPNPSNGTFQINIKGLENQIINMVITNTLNQVIETSTGKVEGKEMLQQFDLSDYNEGIYFVTITTPTEKVTKKISIIK